MMTSFKPLTHKFSLILLMAIIIGSAVIIMPVSAATITVNTTIDEDAANEFCSLREAIIAANTGDEYNGCPAGSGGADTILVPGGIYTLTSGAQLPKITSEIVITGVGAGETIIQASDCNPVYNPGCVPAAYRVFEVDYDKHLTLENLAVRYGLHPTYGGGIYTSGILTLKNTSVYHNRAQASGGGIYVYDSGSVDLVNTTIADNRAPVGGGINNYGVLSAKNSTFVENKSDVAGGGLYNWANVVLDDNTTFSSNEAGYGGGIYNRWSMTLKDSTIQHNHAVFGGGIANYGILDILDSTISGNTAGTQGGGIYNETDGTLDIKNSTLTGNSALSDTSSGGGIYQLQGTLNINNCTLSDNEAVWGGGLLNYDVAKLMSSIITDNIARANGGGVYNADSMEIEDCTISRNFADAHGGGIYNWSGGEIEIKKSAINDNQAFANGGGAFNEAKMTISESSSFSRNQATYGGGIANNADLFIMDTHLAGNRAAMGGGVANFNILHVTRSTLLGNKANTYGGGIYSDTPSLMTVAYSTISQNAGLSATSSGGGIYNLNGTASISHSTLALNEAVWGGGIYNSDILILKNSTLSRNKAENEGGGIRNYDDAILEMRHTTLNRNLAGNAGGGIYCSGSLDYANSIIANSSGGDCVNYFDIVNNKNNLVMDGSCAHNAMDFIVADPVLGPLADNGGHTLTHALLPNSPAIFQAEIKFCEPTDQRSVPRPFGPACDIGAFEYDPTMPAIGFRILLPLFMR